MACYRRLPMAASRASEASAARRATPTERAKADKGDVERKAILAAAYRLLQRGRSELAVQEVLGEAGLSTRAFYRHFRSKDDLVLEMFHTASRRFHDDLASAIQGADGPAAAVDAFIRRHLAVVYDPRAARQALVLSTPQIRAVDGYLAAEWQARSIRLELLRDVLERGMAEGVFANVTEPHADARALLGAVGALMDEHFGGGEVPAWDDAVAHLSALFMRAFGADLEARQPHRRGLRANASV